MLGVRRMLRRVLWALIRAPLMLLFAAASGPFGTAQIDPRRVAIYIRWSTDDQGAGTTLDVQRDGCRHYALSQGWEVPDSRVFIDEGYSGGDLNRPAMTRLREAVRAGEVACVVVYKIDRLSRNIVDATQLVLREWDGTCDLKCVIEPVDTTTQLGRMIFGILAMFADFERSAITGRMFSGKLRRASEGRIPGIRVAYGYEITDTPGVWRVNVEQAAVVRRIFEAYAAGQGAAAIAAQLNTEGLPSWSGGQWVKRTIQHMLRNEAYIGRLIWGKSIANKRKETAGGNARIQREEPLVVRDGAYPPIIAPELFDRCQQIRTTRAKALEFTSGRGLSSAHLLSGLVRCRCGHLYQAWTPTDRSRARHYVCTGKATKGPAFCQAGQINQETLDALVVDELRELTHPHVRAEILQRQVDSIQGRLRDLMAQRTATEHRLRQLEEQERDARSDYRSKAIGAATLEEIRSEIAADRTRAETGLVQLGLAIRQLQESDQALSLLEAALDRLERWDQWDIQARKQLLRDLVREIVVFKPVRRPDLQLHIVYRHGQGPEETPTA